MCSSDLNTAARERYQAPGDIDSGSNIKGPLILEHSLTRSAFLGLDRKQMEEERLQRANQRKQNSDQSWKGESQARKRKASTPPQLPERQGVQRAKTGIPTSAIASSSSSSSLPILSFKDERALGRSGVQFPDGVVKKTWVYGCPRQDDIKIEEVLQKNDLELAVLSSFQIDPDWVASKLDPATKVVFVLQAKTESEVGYFLSLMCHEFSSC